MLILRKNFKEIEYHFYHYFDLKHEIEEKEKEIMSLKSGIPKAPLKQLGKVNNATLDAVIKLNNPDLEEKRKWVKVIEKTLKKYKGTDKEKLINKKYFEQLGETHICMSIPIGRTTYFEWRKEIVTYAAFVAQKMGLIEIEMV